MNLNEIPGLTQAGRETILSRLRESECLGAAKTLTDQTASVDAGGCVCGDPIAVHHGAHKSPALAAI